jgi:hypothetical protein
VGVSRWQSGQSRRRFSSRLSPCSPLMWYKSNASGRPSHCTTSQPEQRWVSRPARIRHAFNPFPPCTGCSRRLLLGACSGEFLESNAHVSSECRAGARCRVLSAGLRR